MDRNQIKVLIRQMTLEEKAGQVFCNSGKSADRNRDKAWDQ